MKTPRKPHPDFPLTPCGNGMWRKIVNKVPYTFGSWRDDPKGERALRDWIARKDAILAGLEKRGVGHTPINGNGITLGEMLHRYDDEREKDVAGGRLSPEQLRDYRGELGRFEKFFGPNVTASAFGPDQFAAYYAEFDRRKLGPHAVKRSIALIRAAFRFAAEQQWIKPVVFGSRFRPPATDPDSVAMYRQRKGLDDKTNIVLTRRQVRALLRAARSDPYWYAAILVALNTASNPAEIARLRWYEIDFRTGRLHRRRGKTGIMHEAYLWKLTRKAINALPRDGERVFKRLRWRDLPERFSGAELPEGTTAYTLRRTARTVAARCPDDGAAKRTMGQRLSGQDSTYIRGKFPMSRLKKVALVLFAKMIRRNKAPAPTKSS